MAESTEVQRRLATIVAVDVAGYSAAMEADEEGVLSGVAALHKIIVESAEVSGGRLFKTAGDGFLMEFATVTGALRATDAIRDRAQLPLRIGVHVGEVSVAPDNDLLGHGVNVAARLQAQAPIGGVLVSSDVVRAVRGTIARRFAARGEIQLAKMREILSVYTFEREGHGMADGAPPPAPAPAPGSPPSAPPSRRRLVLVGVGAAAVAAVGAGAFYYFRAPDPEPPGLKPLLDQAWTAWTQGTSEGSNQAIGLYRRATEQFPEHADAWGLLGCALADRSHNWASAGERGALRERAREAGRRALQLDARNAYGRAAVAYAQPTLGNWLAMEQAFVQAMRDQPGKWLIPYSLALLYTNVGRLSEAAKLFADLRGNAPTATQFTFHVRSLWGAGQVEAAERLLQEANSIYATNLLIWSTRFDMLMSGGRPEAAIALAEDAGARPDGVGGAWLDQRLAVVRAIVSQRPQDADAIARTLLQEARNSAGPASRAIQDLSALGRLDDAFAVTDAYYFSRGFEIPDVPPSEGKAATVTLDARQTGFLFLPPLRALRADPRFDRLVDALGLKRYWQASRSKPDYLA